MAHPWLALLAGACAVAGALSSPVRQLPPPASAGNARSSSSSTSWHKYVRAPPSRIVAPARVLSTYTVGNVSNADGLVVSGSGSGSGPAVLTRLADADDVPTLVLDFGQNVAGQLQIDFAASYNTSEGLPGITLAFSETLQYLGDRSDFTRSDTAPVPIAVEPGPFSWTSQLGCTYGTQVCSDGLHGFRYVKIRLQALASDAPYTSGLGSVSLAAVRLQYAGFLGTPDTFAGHFECSDPDLTQWWYDGVYTNDICTDVFHANDTEPRDADSPELLGHLVIHDGAKRDRDPYAGDLAVSGRTAYLSRNVPEAVRNVLEDLALHQRDDGWIPPASIFGYTMPLFDYPLWWVVCSADYVLYTGNVSYWSAFYPVLLKVLDGYYVDHTDAATSLLERPGGQYDFAFVPRNGSVTYDNALYIRALQASAALAQHLGRAADAARWQARAAAVAPALLARNFDARVGAFFDGGPCDGQLLCPTHPQDGNSMAILAGVVPSGLAADVRLAASALAYLNRTMARPYGNAFFDNSILDPTQDFSNRVYAFASYFEIAARFETSARASQAPLEELRRLYGWMATHDPTVTYWEGIGADGEAYHAGTTSMAHGWSTGVVPLLTNYVLGVSPTAPGFQTWRLQPAIEAVDLTWANGLVPTPSGGIWVQWEKSATGYVLVVDAPEQTQATVTLPFAAAAAGKARTLTVDGRVVYGGGSRTRDSSVQAEGGFVTMTLSGGNHVIVVL